MLCENGKNDFSPFLLGFSVNATIPWKIYKLILLKPLLNHRQNPLVRIFRKTERLPMVNVKSANKCPIILSVIFYFPYNICHIYTEESVKPLVMNYPEAKAHGLR